MSLLFALLAVGPAHADDPDIYAAIAIGPKGERGIGHNFPTFDQAKRAALSDCGDSACEIAVWTRGERCAAATTGKAGKIAWAYGRSADAVERAAMDKCVRHDTGCWTAGIVCNGRPVKTGVKWSGWANGPEAASAEALVAKPEAAAAAAESSDDGAGGAAPPK